MVVTARSGWIARAACAGSTDPRWTDGLYHFDLIDVCGGCAVRSECLMDALESSVDRVAGIRGGLTPEQQQRVRRGAVEPWELWEKQGHPYERPRSSRA